MIADVTGEVETEEGVLVIRRIHVSFRLTASDDVRAAVESVGSPERCASTFCDIGDDDTLPRIPGNSKLLHFSWPLSAVSMHASGVCVALQASSDILGLIFSADGQVQDAFICRRLASGSQLAPIFDGRWVERGWTTYGADPPPLPGGANARVRDIDNEATQPRN